MNKKNNILFMLGAAIFTLLPSLSSKLIPTLNTFTSGCTGVCGNCSGSCIGAFGTVTWLGITAKIYKKNNVS